MTFFLTFHMPNCACTVPFFPAKNRRKPCGRLSYISGRALLSGLGILFASSLLGNDHAVTRRTSPGRPHRQHAARPPARHRARRPRRRTLRQGRVLQPRRLRQGPPRPEHDPGGREVRRAPPRQDHPGRHLGQHRHRLRHDRRGARLPRPAVPAAQRLPGAQEDPARLRRGDRPDQPRRAVRRGHPDGQEAVRRGPRPVLLPRPVRQRRQLAGPLQRPPGRRSGRRPRDASPTSSPAWAPPGR